jgi:hypothetical protein
LEVSNTKIGQLESELEHVQILLEKLKDEKATNDHPHEKQMEKVQLRVEALSIENKSYKLQLEEAKRSKDEMREQLEQVNASFEMLEKQLLLFQCKLEKSERKLKKKSKKKLNSDLDPDPELDVVPEEFISAKAGNDKDGGTLATVQWIEEKAAIGKQDLKKTAVELEMETAMLEEQKAKVQILEATSDCPRETASDEMANANLVPQNKESNINAINLNRNPVDQQTRIDELENEIQEHANPTDENVEAVLRQGHTSSSNEDDEATDNARLQKLSKDIEVLTSQDKEDELPIVPDSQVRNPLQNKVEFIRKENEEQKDAYMA